MGHMQDAETGLDYFQARYYNSTPGRWMVPDWSSVPMAVPYADLSNPQTLNLYTYVGDNPISHTDVDGHLENTPGQPGSPGSSTVENDNSNGAGTSQATTTGGNPNAAPQNWQQQQQSQQQPPAQQQMAQQQENGSEQAQIEGQPSSENQQQQPSWDPSKPFPDDPSGLGPDWSKDTSRKAPNDERWSDGKGNKVEWHPGVPGAKGWQGKNHWHWIPGGRKQDGHYSPGDTIKKAGIIGTIGAAIAVTVHVIVDTAPEWAPFAIP